MKISHSQLWRSRDHNNEWIAIVIYRRRSIETPAPRQYQELMQHRVRRIYLDELGEAAEQYIGIGIVQLVVESKKKTPGVAQNLIAKVRQELTDTVNSATNRRIDRDSCFVQIPQSKSRGIRSHAGIERTEKDQSLSRSP